MAPPPLLGTRAPRGRAIVAAALGAASLAGCHRKVEADGEKQPPVEVRCAAVTHVGIEQTVVLRGRTAPPPGGDLPVAAQIAGRVLETRVKEGDRLTKGAIVAVVDDLAPRAAERQADAALARARSADVNAQAALERVKTLAEKGIASKREVEDATTRAEAAKAEIDADLAALRLANGTLGRVDVRSTFDGVVTRVWRGAGALVDGTASTPIVQLAATRSVEFVADVTERDLGLLKEGQKAEITLSTSDAKLAGTVLARPRALDPATGLGTVRILVDEEIPLLGAFGRVVLHVGHRDGVMVIPPSALRGAVADGAEIAVCKGDKIELRAVQVGYRDATQIEITSGLKDGEKVVIEHALGLDDDTVIVEAKGDKGDKADNGEGDEDRKK